MPRITKSANDDIVTQLRRIGRLLDDLGLCEDAAEEIERLREEIRILNEGAAHNAALDRAEIAHWKEQADER